MGVRRRFEVCEAGGETRQQIQWYYCGPPPYGRGPDGEKWTLQEKLNELIQLSGQLLENENHFFILNMYTVGLSALVGLNVAQTHFKVANPEFGEFLLKSRQGSDLPMGTFLRFKN